MIKKVIFKLLRFRNCLESYFYKPSKTKVLNVPYISAKPGNCGIGCIAMLLRLPSVENLERKYKTNNFYNKKLGWLHQGMMNILEGYGLKSLSRKFQSMDDVTKNIYNEKPVIVSLQVPEPNNLGTGLYSKQDKSKPNVGHLCVVTGITQKGFIIHDPRNVGIYSKNLTVPFCVFAKIFTGNTIIVEMNSNKLRLTSLPSSQVQ